MLLIILTLKQPSDQTFLRAHTSCVRLSYGLWTWPIVKKMRVKIEKCASFIIEIVHFLLLSERATCRFYWFCGASCWVALQGVFFFSCRFYFLMIKLVMSLSLQAIVTPFFFLSRNFSKPYLPSPIYFFNVLPLKFLCNPILKINISTE